MTCANTCKSTMTLECQFCLNSFLRETETNLSDFLLSCFTDVSNQISVVSLAENYYYSLPVVISIIASIFLSQLIQNNIGKLEVFIVTYTSQTCQKLEFSVRY